MKKIHSLLLFLLCTLLGTVHAQTVQVPVAGTKYVIIHSGNYVLSGAAANARIVDPTGAEDQNFEFVPVDGKNGVYNIKNSSTEKYLGLDSPTGYTSVWGDDGSSELYQFTVELVDDVYVKFLNVGTGRTNNFLGTDGAWSGAGVYTDKSGLTAQHHWTLRLPSAELAKEFLQKNIDAAKDSLTKAVPGNEVGQYPADAISAFEAAIGSAEGALTGTVDEWIAARAALSTALTTFLGEKIAFIIKSDVAYYIRHSGGMFLGKGSPNVCLTVPSGADTQQFKFVAVSDQKSTYNIQLVASEEYLTKEGSYNLKWGTDASVNSAQYKLELAADGHLVFKCLNNNAYVGTDNSTAASGVYSNKSAGAENSHWALIEVDPNAVMTDYLDYLIAAAEQLIENSPVGDKGHQWPQTAVDELAAAVVVAKGVVADPKSQENVNTAAEALNAAITTFKAAEITPMLEPAAGDKYRYAVAKYSDKFMNYNGENVKTTATRVAADAGQLWEMIPVAGSAGKFIMKQGDLAFNADDSFTMSTYDASSSVQVTLQFIMTQNGIDYYGLLREDGKVLTFGSGTTAAWQAFTSTNNAHQGIFTKADLPHDPVKTSLISYMPTAKNQLASKTYGTESGLWSIHSKDSLTLIINKAQAIIDGNGNTQEVVDKMLEDIKGTVAWHEKQKITVILDELNAAIIEAAAAKNAAVVGTKQGQYYQSVIDEFVNGPIATAKAALKLSVQAEVDAAAEAMKAATEEFKTKGHAADVGVDRVLQEAIESAEALANSVTPGINKGDYPASAKEEFVAAIATAKTSPVTQETLDVLLAARTQFEASVLTVDRSALNSAIQSAKTAIGNAVVGDCDGQYTQGAKDTYQAAINAAELAYPNLALSQEEIDAATTTLKDAGTAFSATKIVIDFSALRDAITQATATVTAATPEKGEGPGTYPESAFTAINAAIEAAKGINGSKTVNQAAVDAAVTTLNTAETTFKAARVPNDYTALQNKITDANTWLDETEVGSEAGQVSAAAVTSLQTSIATAEALLTSTKQADINAGVARLNKDIELFKAEIVEADVTALTGLITASKAAIKKYNIKEGEIYTRLAEVLAEAEELAEEPIVKQSVVDKLVTDLSKALEDYINATGLSSVELDEVAIYAEDGVLYVNGLPGNSTVKVFTASGALVSVNNVAGEGLNLSLGTGIYVLQIEAGKAMKSIRTIVK